MNRMTRPSCLPSSLRTAFRRSSNSPRNLAPAISAPCPGPAGACPEAVRHFAVDDALGQALDDGGLADAGFADQHRVVLGPPLQDLDGPADLVVATDHRVELAFLGALGHVDGVLVQRLARLLDVRVVHRFAATQVGHGILQRLARHALAEQQLAEPGVLVHRGQQYQLAGDELVALLLGQAVSLVEQACEILGQVHVAGRALDLRQRVEFFVEAAAQGGDIEADLHQQGLDRTALLLEQGGKQVHRLDGRMVMANGQDWASESASCSLLVKRSIRMGRPSFYRAGRNDGCP